ncbi:hypothetical protein KSP39_PZI008846 [Platanthera zijinensis]|uniref:VQ domain-containing protein n=1 Tax=Platanthera zijinensis TaxID=2320716 RepID=A0AAP0BK20_9ASPA
MDSSSSASTAAGDSSPIPLPPAITYVQTDATTFKELVQRLTGPHDDVPSSKPAGVRGPSFKLHERRRASRSKLSVLKPIVSPQPLPFDISFSSPASRSPLVSPSTQLSVLSISDVNRSPEEINEDEEEKAIRERRFYLHPSPRLGRTAEPELLTLFPLHSPGKK